MTDFLTRLAKRTLGVVPVAQPIIAPMFAPGPAMAGFPVEGEALDVVDETGDRTTAPLLAPTRGATTFQDAPPLAATPDLATAPPQGAINRGAAINRAPTDEGRVPADAEPTGIVAADRRPADRAPARSAPIMDEEMKQVIRTDNVLTREDRAPARSAPIMDEEMKQVVHSDSVASMPSRAPARDTSDIDRIVPIMDEEREQLVVPDRASAARATGARATARVAPTIHEAPTMVEHGGDAKPSMVGAGTLGGAPGRPHRGGAPGNVGVPLVGTLGGVGLASALLEGVPIMDPDTERPVRPELATHLEQSGSIPTDQRLLVPKGIQPQTITHVLDKSALYNLRNDLRPKDEHLVVPNVHRPQVVPSSLEENGWMPTNQHSAVSASEESSSPPTIRVTIGRIDVRAVTPPTSPPRHRPSRPAPALSLDDYQKQRKGGER